MHSEHVKSILSALFTRIVTAASNYKISTQPVLKLQLERALSSQFKRLTPQRVEFVEIPEGHNSCSPAEPPTSLQPSPTTIPHRLRGQDCCQLWPTGPRAKPGALAPVGTKSAIQRKTTHAHPPAEFIGFCDCFIFSVAAARSTRRQASDSTQ